MDPFTKAARSLAKAGKNRFTRQGEFTSQSKFSGGEQRTQTRRRLMALERRATAENTAIGYGPGTPPRGFVGGTTSLTEWYVHWALDILSREMGFTFTFQESYQGGRYVPGGSVADFVVYLASKTIILRVQTFYFHLSRGSQTLQYDFRQQVGLVGAYGGQLEVYNLYDQRFIHDKTGRAVLREVQDAINGIQHENPVAIGMTLDVY